MVNMNKEYTEINNYNLNEMLFNRDEKLIQIIKDLKQERDYIFNKLTSEKAYLQEILNKKEDRIDHIKEHTNYIIGITDDERILAECNLIEEELEIEK